MIRSFSKNRLFALFALALAAAASAAFVKVSPILVLALPDGSSLVGWSSGTLRALHLPLVAAAALFSAFSWRVSRVLPPSSPLSALRHLAFFPLVVALSTSAPWLGRVFSSICLPLGTAAITAAVASRLYETLPVSCKIRVPALAVFASMFALLVAVWFGHAQKAHFRGSGDVSHYRIQTENLLERGDFDLTDRMEAEMEKRHVVNKPLHLRYSHMKRNAKGRIHSVHSFGFPLLAAAFIKIFGSLGETILKALIGALALVGCRAACLAGGARKPAAGAIAAFLGLSFVFVYDALAFLPEMLGFALCAWAVWGALAQDDPRRRAAGAAAAAVCCSYLPFAHIRFSPMAAALFGFFAVESLCVGGEPFFRRKVLRTALAAAVFGASIAVLLHFHREFFGDAGAYDYKDIALGDPSVMWWIFADRRGLAASFPAIFVCVAAPVCALAGGGKTARRAFLALGVLASVLLSCCCTTAALGGACLPGRYLFPVVPALLPFLAIAVEKTDGAGRLWIFSLLALPVLYFVFVSFSIFGSQLLRVPSAMRSIDALQAWWEPMASHRSGSCATHLAGTVFTCALFALSFLACLPPIGLTIRLGLAAPLLLTAFFAGAFVEKNDPPDRGSAFETLRIDKNLHSWKRLGAAQEDIFAAFKTPPIPDRPELNLPPLRLSSLPPEDPKAFQRCVDPADVKPCGEGGSSLRYVPIRKSAIRGFGRRGAIAFRVKGRVEEGNARLALWRGKGFEPEGGFALPRGKFDVVVRLDFPPQAPYANLFAALEADTGTVVFDSIDFAPWAGGIGEVFAPPAPGVTVIEFKE